MYTLLAILYGILFQEEAGKALDIAFASLSKKGVIHLAIGYATEVRRLVNGLAARIGVLEQELCELSVKAFLLENEIQRLEADNCRLNKAYWQADEDRTNLTTEVFELKEQLKGN